LLLKAVSSAPALVTWAEAFAVPAAPAAPAGPAGPAVPVAPVAPFAPFGSCPALKSFLSSEPFLTYADVTLLAGSLRAA
jgi:hypothetical protein